MPEAHESLLYERLEGGAVRCHVCQWRCRIGPGRLGYCRTRRNEAGVLRTLIYGEVSSANVDPIEKKPLYHFYPATSVFSLGTWGCNFRCIHCQNWNIAYAQADNGGWIIEGQRQPRGEKMSPERAVQLAEATGGRGLAWTYNEPSIWLEYTLDCARLAHERGLYTVYVTNGYITPEGLDVIGPHLDAYRVDIKGFSDDTYFKLARLPRGKGLRGILEVVVRAQQKWGMHIEVVTNLIPGLNDSEAELQALAEWLRDHLGPQTPWHITRFFPQAHLTDRPPTPLASLRRAREIGLAAGLQFVYLGNVADEEGSSTRCPRCGTVAIQRHGYSTQLVGVAPGGFCRACGATLNLRGV